MKKRKKKIKLVFRFSNIALLDKLTILLSVPKKILCVAQIELTLMTVQLELRILVFGLEHQVLSHWLKGP